MIRQTGRICVSRNDAARLRALLQSSKGSVGGVTAQYQGVLESELCRARVLPAERVPDDVIGLGSAVEITDIDTGSAMKIIIVVQPAQPISRRLTAHGNRNAASRSNMMNNMAIR